MGVIQYSIVSVTRSWGHDKIMNKQCMQLSEQQRMTRQQSSHIACLESRVKAAEVIQPRPNHSCASKVQPRLLNMSACSLQDNLPDVGPCSCSVCVLALMLMS